jgi:hypothetical protein
MPDHTCPHLSPIGGWCRLKANFKCPASVGRVGCPFPKVPDMNRRASERLEEINIPVSAVRAPVETLYANRARGFEELSQPFPAALVEWRVVSLSRDGRRALLKPSIGVRTVIDRLDSAVGAGGWSESYQNLPSGHVSCRLTVLGIHKEALSERAEDLGEARSEALLLAAAKFGIGRSLERINGVWVDWDEEHERPLETPVLPAWAVADTPKLETRLPVTSPSVALSEAKTQEKMIQEIIRAVRELPGGESALRRIMKRHNRLEDKRSLYAELRRTYRELSSSALKAA